MMNERPYSNGLSYTWFNEKTVILKNELSFFTQNKNAIFAYDKKSLEIIRKYKRQFILIAVLFLQIKRIDKRYLCTTV